MNIGLCVSRLMYLCTDEIPVGCHGTGTGFKAFEYYLYEYLYNKIPPNAVQAFVAPNQNETNNHEITRLNPVILYTTILADGVE